MSSNKVLANQEPNKFLISEIKDCRIAIKQYQRNLNFINDEISLLDLTLKTSLRGDFRRQINASSKRFSHIRVQNLIKAGLSARKNILKSLKDQLIT